MTENNTTEPDEMAAGTEDVVDLTDEQPTNETDARDRPDDEEPDEDTKGGREAAKYRRRLRDTEAERDALSERVASLQRAEAERMAAATLAKPAGLWATGTDLADLLGEDGNIDASKVTTAATAARDELGLAPKRANHVPNEGGNPRVKGPKGSMADVVMGKAH